MKNRLLPGLGAVLLASPLLGQNLRQVRIETPTAPQLSVTLEQQGFDVLEGSVQASSLELVVSDPELEELVARGLAPVVLAVGRPYREIQGAGGEGEAAVPAGYPDLTSVVAQMSSAAQSFPAICELVDLTARYGAPPTWEGRHIFAVKISDNVAQDENEPNFLMVSAHHCRELVTPVIALDAITRLTTGYSVDPQITALVDSNEIWIAPVWNVDGYEYVFNVNNLWRKNRHVFSNGVGVDLNRNYAFGWSSACSGSTFVGSNTYKGPGPLSEAETITMVLFTQDRHFAKVLDFHSFGRETLWEYGCLNHPFASFMHSEAITLSTQSGYGGSNRPPSANGEQFEWQIAQTGAMGFLTETHVTFQPTFTSAVNEAAKVWPGTVWFLERAIPVTGTVTDSGTGQPLTATLTYSGVTFQNGEKVTSGGPAGRYHAWLPAGSHTLNFDAPGYAPQSVPVTVTGTAGQTVDVAMVPLPSCGPASTTFRNGTGINPPCLQSQTLPIIGSRWRIQIDTTAVPGATLTLIQGRRLATTGPILPFGELLIDLTSQLVFQSLSVPSAGAAVHELQIPPVKELAGVPFTIQGGIQISGVFQLLCNAEDVVLGCGP